MEVKRGNWYTREEAAAYLERPVEFVGVLASQKVFGAYRGAKTERTGLIRGRDLEAVKYQLTIGRPRTEMLARFEDREVVRSVLGSFDTDGYGFKIGFQCYIFNYKIGEFEEEFERRYQEAARRRGLKFS